MKIQLSVYIPKYDLTYKGKIEEVNDEQLSEIRELAFNLYKVNCFYMETSENVLVYIPKELCAETIVNILII